MPKFCGRILNGFGTGLLVAGAGHLNGEREGLSPQLFGRFNRLASLLSASFAVLAGPKLLNLLFEASINAVNASILHNCALQQGMQRRLMACPSLRIELLLFLYHRKRNVAVVNLFELCCWCAEGKLCLIFTRAINFSWLLNCLLIFCKSHRRTFPVVSAIV